MVAGGAGYYFLAGSLKRGFGEREKMTKRIRKRISWAYHKIA